MSKRRLPPVERLGKSLIGRNVKSFTVGSWCPTLDGTGPAQAVAIAIALESGEQLVLRLKSPQRVDDMVQALLRHKRDVWPEAP